MWPRVVGTYLYVRKSVPHRAIVATGFEQECCKGMTQSMAAGGFSMLLARETSVRVAPPPGGYEVGRFSHHGLHGGD